LYTGISSGKELAIADTRTKVTKHLKPHFIKPAWEKQQTHY
jgi:hypothetical protein